MESDTPKFFAFDTVVYNNLLRFLPHSTITSLSQVDTDVHARVEKNTGLRSYWLDKLNEYYGIEKLPDRIDAKRLYQDIYASNVNEDILIAYLTDLAGGDTADDDLIRGMFNEALTHNAPYLLEILLADPRVGSIDLNHALDTSADEGYYEIVKLLLKDPRVKHSYRVNSSLVRAVEKGHDRVVKLLLEDPRVDTHSNAGASVDYLLLVASSLRTPDVLRVLLEDPRFNPSSQNNILVANAVNRTSREVFEFLLADPRVDPSARDNAAIIRAVSLGRIEIVKLLLADPRVDPSVRDNEAIIEAAMNGSSSVVEVLLKDPRVDPSARDNAAIIQAVMRGSSEIVKLLLTDPRVDPSAKDNKALMDGASIGNVSTVDLLLKDKRVDPSTHNNYPIITASARGHADLVAYLLKNPRVNPAADDNQPIISAARGGHVDVVKMLLADPRVDPTAKHNYALAIATKLHKHNIVNLLLRRQDVTDMLRSDALEQYRDCDGLDMDVSPTVTTFRLKEGAKLNMLTSNEKPQITFEKRDYLHGEEEGVVYIIPNLMQEPNTIMKTKVSLEFVEVPMLWSAVPDTKDVVLFRDVVSVSSYRDGRVKPEYNGKHSSNLLCLGDNIDDINYLVERACVGCISSKGLGYATLAVDVGNAPSLDRYSVSLITGAWIAGISQVKMYYSGPSYLTTVVTDLMGDINTPRELLDWSKKKA